MMGKTIEQIKQEESELSEEYRRDPRMQILDEPYPVLIVLAHRSDETPMIWAKKIKYGWLVISAVESYMEKGFGMFSSKLDEIEDHCFPSIEEAIEAFHKFYKTESQ